MVQDFKGRLQIFHMLFLLRLRFSFNLGSEESKTHKYFQLPTVKVKADPTNIKHPSLLAS